MNYVLKDSDGNAGKVIPITRGESKSITAFLLNKDGSPLVIVATITEILVKIFSNVSQAPIQKTLSGTSVVKVDSTALSGTFGFQFSLSAAETLTMAANNSGLPMTATVTDNTGKVSEFDFSAAFDVSLPSVP